MKRLNPDTGKPFKKGETDARGYTFLTYSKSRTNKAGYFAEYWASPERQKTLEAAKETAIRRVNEETGTQFKRGDLNPTSGKRFFGYKKFVTKDGFYGEYWITEAEWQEYLVSKSRLPSKEKAQEIIDDRTPAGEPRKLVKEVLRLSKGRDASRVLVKIICVAHEKETSDGRLARLYTDRPAPCKQCGNERSANKQKRTISEIKLAIAKWADVRDFPVKLVKISSDQKTLYLECGLHGEKQKSTKLAVERGQICEECVDQSGENSANFLSLEKRCEMVVEKYPDLEFKLKGLIKISGKHKVVCDCIECGEEIIVDWNSIIGRGQNRCRSCGNKSSAMKRSLPLEIVLERFSERGLELEDVRQYEKSTTPIYIKCNACGTRKCLPPTQIFSSYFPCSCTYSIPKICEDLVFGDVSTVFPEAQKGFKIANSFVDIWVPNKKLIVEIKYGDIPFGDPNSSNKMIVDRSVKTEQQLQNYLNLDCRVTYLIIADRQHSVYEPNFPDDVETIYLPELADHLFWQRIMSAKTLLKLQNLYKRPYTVRGMMPYSSLEQVELRKRLRFFLEQNGLVTPTQKQFRKYFGCSQRKLHSALGLGRRANKNEVEDAVSYWFSDLFNNKENAILQWLTNCTDYDSGSVISTSVVFDVFCVWSKKIWPLHKISRQQFTQMLTDSGVEITRINSTSHFRGIKFKNT